MLVGMVDEAKYGRIVDSEIKLRKYICNRSLKC